MRFSIVVLMMMAGAGGADPVILGAVNAQRADNGRAALVYDDQLEAVAHAHGTDMATQNFFSHSGSDGSDIAARLTRAGYRWCFAAENIAVGQPSLEAVMSAWMGSPGHRQNILHRQANSVGVARVTGNRWVMVLAAPC